MQRDETEYVVKKAMRKPYIMQRDETEYVVKKLYIYDKNLKDIFCSPFVHVVRFDRCLVFSLLSRLVSEYYSSNSCSFYPYKSLHTKIYQVI